MPPPHKQLHSSILVIEDDEVSACLVEYLLQREGYQIATVYSQAHFDNMFTSMLPPDLIFMGSHIHFCEPIDMINRIHAHEKWSHAPVVLLVNESHEDIEKLNKLLKNGVDDYILKPFGPADIMSVTCHFTGDSMYSAKKL